MSEEIYPIRMAIFSPMFSSFSVFIMMESTSCPNKIWVYDTNRMQYSYMRENGEWFFCDKFGMYPIQMKATRYFDLVWSQMWQTPSH